MQKTRLEIANPQEWLVSLAADADGFSLLVQESGGMARAAYRLARARCLALYEAPPQLSDLQAAAALLSARLGGHSVLPITSLLPAPPISAPPSGNPSARAAARVIRREEPPLAGSFPPPAPSSLRRTRSRPHAQRVTL